MHSPVNAEPGMAPLCVDILGGLGPIKGPDMHAANQNPATCAVTVLNLSVPRALLSALYSRMHLPMLGRSLTAPVYSRKTKCAC